MARSAFRNGSPPAFSVAHPPLSQYMHIFLHTVDGLHPVSPPEVTQTPLQRSTGEP
jgi:hypothetical protein